MKVYALIAENVYDCAGELFDSGSVLSIFSTLEKANAAFENIEEDYTRKKRDYDIIEYEVE